MIPVLITSEEWTMLSGDGHVEVDFARNTIETPMGLWVSRGLHWLAMPLAKTVLPDDAPLPLRGGRIVVFRRLTAEWLTWLRRDFQHRDPQSVLGMQDRMVCLRDAITVYVPHLQQAEVDLTDDYGPPHFDSVTHCYR